jgi:crotonobetainyl-CoA:carnitine CoA-transferase CaiB-like acyl-CoA transferase
MSTAAKPKPLAGLRILSVEQYGAGPFGSMYLSDLGADVIKLENPDGGDVSRATGPYFLGASDSEFFQTFNLGKRSITVDLKHAKGREVLHRLVPHLDAVMNNLRGDQPAKLGLDYAALSPLKPSIVCAHLSAYGRGHEREAWPGYDYLMQAEAGYLSLTGEPDAPPSRFGLSMVDYMSGVTTALGLVSAVLGARTSGVGRDVDVALFDVALHQLSYPATWYLNQGHKTERLERSAHPSTVPCQLYKTADGYVFVMAMLDKFWQEFVRGIGRSEWAQDARFIDFAARRTQRLVLTELIDAALQTQSTAHWLAMFQGKLPIAPVLDIASALDNPFVERRELIAEIDHAAASDGKLRVLRNPILLDGERIAASACHALGADAETILRELGFSAADIALMKSERAI